MVSAADVSDKSRLDGAARPPSKKRRFKLLAALLAPFKDVDERAVPGKSAKGAKRNNGQGEPLSKGGTPPPTTSGRRFSSDGD